MKGRLFILIFAGWVFVAAQGRLVLPVCVPTPQEAADRTPDAGGEHLRIETEHGPLHLWRPAQYDPRTAGMVVYIHGYFTPVDQAWTDDHLDTQFRDSGRNALFIAIEAPQLHDQDVSWKSLEDLLHTIEDRAPIPLPRGPLVVVGHSAGYRTILLWLPHPRVQYVILLDGLYAGQPEFRYWLRPHPGGKPHRMVLVSNETSRQSNRFARHISSVARRRSVPAKASSFTPRETHARLLYLRSQYNHGEIISSGKVIPLLLQITPLKALAAEKSRPTKTRQNPPPALDK